MKKSVFIVITVLLLLLSACSEKQKPTMSASDSASTQSVESESQDEQTVTETRREIAELKYTHAVYELSIVETLLSNDSVGEEWFNVYSCNDEQISSGKRWIVPLDKTETVIIESFITEDDEHPDTAFVSSSIVLSDGFEKTEIVKVTENHGRYKGSCAQWKITYRVKLIQKLIQ